MTIEASKLRIDLQEQAGWRRTLSVTVPADVVSEEREKIAARLARKLKLPGFRTGRIPASVVEKRYGPAVNREMLDRVIGEAYREALRAESLRPISEGEVEAVEYQPERDLVFSISFDVQPEIELARLGGFKVERPKAEVEDADVDKVLERLRQQAGAWRPVEEGTPADGDLVAVSVQRLDVGEQEPRDYELVLGEGDAIPDIERAIATLGPGESGTFAVRFPDDFP
ncbi:MAG TPA: trigger factor, partial [Candidatus Limnocylindrales bacterium]|nr:trigger factor [Candidatus Limnocylindrales bacterium]